MTTNKPHKRTTSNTPTRRARNTQTRQSTLSDGVNKYSRTTSAANYRQQAASRRKASDRNYDVATSDNRISVSPVLDESDMQAGTRGATPRHAHHAKTGSAGMFSVGAGASLDPSTGVISNIGVGQTTNQHAGYSANDVAGYGSMNVANSSSASNYSRNAGRYHASASANFDGTSDFSRIEESDTVFAHHSDATAQPYVGSQPQDANQPHAAGQSHNASQSHATPQSRTASPKKKRNKKKVIAVLIAILIVCGGAFGGITYFLNMPVDVTLNGKSVTLQGDERTADGVLSAKLVTVTAGNKLAVDNSVLEKGAGDKCSVTVNDKEAASTDRFFSGDTITISNGADTMESYTDSNKQTIASGNFYITGVGALHVYEGENVDGEKVTRTGNESGKTVDIISKEADSVHLTKYNASTTKKIIALTFDDGPWPTTTEEILDVLKQYNAKATFFTIGRQISGKEDIIKRMSNEGHQICTHTYDHASGSGQSVSLIYMSTSERRDEVTKGYEAIEAATGKTASHVMRAPGGNFDEAVASDVQDLVTAEIGWNIDTEDWSKPGTSTIVSRIEQAKSGSIVLMHDGGGDRSQTVEALKIALPYLQEQGYTFVTIDELMAQSTKA